LKPSDIANIQDLEKLPILTKQIIKQNLQDFLPQTSKGLEYINGSTGGSTGEPLKYRMSHEDHERGVALLYRCWAHAGYQLGDRLAVIAGSSLIPTTSSAIHKRLQGFALNTQSYSSFGMSEKTLFRYLRRMNRFKPKFIRGYASSVYLFANFIHSHKLAIKFHPQAVFTTAEKLFENQRETIEHVFGVKVFDNYGLNDGGVSACECEEHSGMHTSTERAILEVVDEDGNPVNGQIGHILATSLYNYSFPFVRYDTGDLGTLEYSECSCGRNTPLLKGIAGRVTDFLELNGRVIGSPVLTVLFGKFDIQQYQIIQEDPHSITCRVIRGKTYSKEDEWFIRASFYKHVGNIDIQFDYVDSIPSTGAGKYKFIINDRAVQP
jgi:phenylacetate-CoA ligase